MRPQAPIVSLVAALALGFVSAAPAGITAAVVDAALVKKQCIICHAKEPSPDVVPNLPITNRMPEEPRPDVVPNLPITNRMLAEVEGRDDGIVGLAY
ncbi:hypothetical protein MIND_00774700 [Mycena indigotica]|uniref:Cytochrome c domain-containing protein n=1 Tax=Mycena indigotica TaxID=2126181 RepID=A0A8H6SQF6_9AGAR|nr:uncharacterized protein MIND_00774700 [Mycena indigotica]KAF7302080.1 hypothetical protein MIND_00774700 [Mycena indigotica]